MLAPTLVIGLGGTGSKIVLNVERKATPAQKESLSFVIFDTDANELRDLVSKGYQGDFIQTSSNMTVGEYLNLDSYARDTWFPVNNILNRKTLTEGAGQVRSISKLAFDAVVRSGNMDPLHKAIERLYRLTGNSTEQALRVIIVSSLAGGTGSGLILPLSMYIKNYLINHYQQNSSVIRGFFVLPEVFYKVSKSISEKNSLSANAYATLRELDAFLMRGDGSLGDRYKNLKFMVPRPGTPEYDNYDVMPFDFCFLYDAQNINHGYLDSFDSYIHHAADCIYAQSISPMSKRSNSSEDNVVRDLCKSGGRNRYCGAGAALLEYPYETIREFVALNWAQDVIGKQWMQYDKLYEEEKIRLKERQRQTGSMEKLSLSQFYVDTVDATVDKNNDLSAEIKSSCYDIIVGEEEPLGRWYRYLSGIEDYITGDVVESQAETNEKGDMCKATLQELDAKENRTSDRIQMLDDQTNAYYAAATSEVKRVANSIAYNLFAGLKSPMENSKPYYLEEWLKIDGQAIHPNAIRYFIYQAVKAMKERKNELDYNLDKINEFWTKQFPLLFDRPQTAKKVESKEEVLVSLKDQRFFNKSEYERIIQAYTVYIKNVDDFRVQYILKKVLEFGIDYLNKISSAYELFYRNLEQNIRKMDDRKNEIRVKFKNNTGNPVRYVCASEKCMDEFAKRTVSTGSASEVPGELSQTIYNLIRNYVVYPDMQEDKRYFQSAFNGNVMDFWKNYIDKMYGGSLLDLNILQAMAQEAEFEKNLLNQSDQIHYMEAIFDEIDKLSAPFITKPLGEERRIIRSCTYSNVLSQWAEGEMKNLFQRRMKDQGGEQDDSGIDKTMIIFYQAIYGLRAADMTKFAPPCKAQTVPETPGGNYYTAYYDLVNRISPNSAKTKYLSPHIDKEWHYITSLPELDEANQTLIEKEICKSMIYGLVMRKIRYESISSYTEKYRYKIAIMDEENDTLVSNDQACDNFYEVLIGLIKSHNAVERINALCNEEINAELNSKKEIDDSVFMNYLSKFVLEEVNKTDIRSIFEIPLIYSQSAPMSCYDKHFAILLVECAYDILKDYMEKFLSKEDLEYKLGVLITKQYRLFKDNIQKLEQKWPRTAHNPLIGDIKAMISGYLMNLGFLTEMDWVNGTISDEEYKQYWTATYENGQ